MLEFISNPWEVVETDFPAQGSPEEQLRFLLNYTVLAPSRLNTQPWLFRDERRALLSLKRREALPNLLTMLHEANALRDGNEFWPSIPVH